jgi:hypothetical protein
MMSVLERQHRISDTGAESPRSDSRLVFPRSPTAQGVVDDSWPRSPSLRAGLSATCTSVALRSVPPPVGRSRPAKREQAGR